MALSTPSALSAKADAHWLMVSSAAPEQNIITTMDAGGDLLALERHPGTQRMLDNVTATFNEILAIAMYVRANYCDGCRWMEGD